MKANQIRHQDSIILERRKGFELEGPVGTTLQVTHGEVWVTRHRDTKDHLLVAGDMLEHAGKGKTLVTALRDARIRIQRPKRKKALWTSLQGLFRVVSRVA